MKKIFNKDIVDLVDTLAKNNNKKTLDAIEMLLRELILTKNYSSELELVIFHDYVLDLIDALQSHRDVTTATPQFVRDSIFLANSDYRK